MKIRQGFVSNSSSTSFCIYGVALDGLRQLNLQELCKLQIERLKASIERLKQYPILDDETQEKFISQNQKELEFFENAKNMETEDLYEKLEEQYELYELTDIIGDVDLNVYIEPYSNTIFIGIPPHKMNDVDIVGEWKEQVQYRISKIVNAEPEDFGWIEEGWCNG